MGLLVHVLADGAHDPPPSHSLGESIVGLTATAVGVWLFVRALLQGSGPCARGSKAVR